VLAFIAQRDPEAAAACQGIPRSQIEAIERQYGIALPSNYVSFLETMGENSDGLYLFGFTRAHQFSRLIRRLPSTLYPMQSYFKVAMESSPSPPSFEDVYLDLQRSDQYDGPLVRFELPLEPDSEIEEEPLSVTERIIYEIAWQVDVSRMPFGAKVLVFRGGPSRDPHKTKQDAANMLREIGFTSRLPDLPRVASLAQAAMTVLVSIDEELVSFELGGESREAVEMPMKALLAAIPGAVLQDTPAPRSDSGA
jgi:hypothetical protein